MNEINLTDLFKYLLKKWYIIVFTVLVFTVCTVIYSSSIKKPIYESTTSLVLTKTNDSTITQNDLVMNQKLVYTYSELIKSKLVLNQVRKNLNLDISYKDLVNEINVFSIENTEMIKVVVKDYNKENSYKIANEIAKVFCKQVTKIYEINNVSIVDKANIPKRAANDNKLKDLIIGFVSGLLLSVGGLFIIFYFDDTIKNSEDVDDLNIPIIGKILKEKRKRTYRKHNNVKINELVVATSPKSVISEGIKSVRTNLLFSSVDKELKSLLITSSMPGEGKSFISANLAIAFAQTDKKVLIVDCDMRRGRQNKIFNVANDKGLSDLLVTNFETKYSEYVKETKIKKVYLLPCGTFPPNPSELLNSDKFKNLVNFLSSKFDLVIFDGVPCNGLPDSIIMSTLVDETIIVSSEGVTPKELLKNTKKELESVNANIAGIILNKVNGNGSKYYGRYYSYYGEKR